jgi:hypothetical protein
MEAARQHLQEALAVNPNASAPHYSLGLVLKNLNDPKNGRSFSKRSTWGRRSRKSFGTGQGSPCPGRESTGCRGGAIYQEGLRKRNSTSIAASKAAQGDKEIASGDPQKAVAFTAKRLKPRRMTRS